MPTIEVHLNEGEEAEFGRSVIDAAARQMLYSYVLGDSEEREVPTHLQRQLEKLIADTLREQAKEATPGIVAEILEQGVSRTNTYGERIGGEKMTVREVIADEVGKALTYRGERHSHGRQADSALEAIIRDEVDKQLKTELREAVAEGKQRVLDVLRSEATTALTQAMDRTIKAGI